MIAVSHDYHHTIIIYRMDPENGKGMYKPLTSTSQQIRLLWLEPRLNDSIRCTLKIFELAECPPFKALSYTWGPPYPVQSIQIDGQPFNVRRNLWEFLNISEEYESWLWVDAICIDQTSTRERNHQVQFIHQIFRTADEVLIWLGQEADDSMRAINYLHFWYPFYQKRGPAIMTKMSREVNSKCTAVQRESVLQARAIEALLRRPYWSRVWIVQDILHGRQITIVCGASRVQWEIFSRFVEWHSRETFNMGVYKLRSSLHSPNLQLQIIGPVQAIINYKGSRMPSLRDRRITTILKEFEYSQSTDVRDKVFSLLSLFEEKSRVPVDYDISSNRLLFDTLRKAAETECWSVSLQDHIQFALSLQRGLKVSEYQKSTIMLFVVNEVKRQKELALSNGFSAYKSSTQLERR
ncbi:hypothetical protein K491DRAFT_759859 [Lophiostoma macrostomum CBS 122681]|uniref:Heterokaryon incompatibility domain-containing protein n=1 Tax=Lophiostoma macrostomum CBS 122681 TaxID=1314788 RepID=A0A6A6T2T3_9PLEO|nr:hypothetical protein K491DRAFT_759859 [Lophiostoma macrostomum CBS 122681]